MSILGSINTLVDVDSDSDSPVHKRFSLILDWLPSLHI